MRRSTSGNTGYWLGGTLLLIVLWQILSMLLGQQRMVFPGPVMTFRYVIYLLGREYTYRCIFQTLLKMIGGFLLSCVLALFLGLLSGNYPFLEKLLRPSVITIRAIPTASLVYLFIVLAGFRMAPMLLVVMISFPIIYEGVCGGIRNVPTEMINAAKVDGSSFLRANLKVRLPLAMPYIVVALTTSFSLCFKIEIMAEVMTGSSNAGLGSAILGARSADPTDMVPIFAYSMIAVMIMLLIDFLAELIKNKLRSSL